eukprot:329490-Prymnesium_polylepis.1
MSCHRCLFGAQLRARCGEREAAATPLWRGERDWTAPFCHVPRARIEGTVRRGHLEQAAPICTRDRAQACATQARTAATSASDPRTAAQACAACGWCVEQALESLRPRHLR